MKNGVFKKKVIFAPEKKQYYCSKLLKKTILIYLFNRNLIYGYATKYPKIENTVRLMSYNIQNAKGMDNVVDYQRVADVIIKMAPDAVALQELDSVTNRSKQVDVLSRLASLTAMYSVYSASISFEEGKYGIGVLSKEKPVSWERISLPGREEARSALMVEFKDYVLCCTHFSLNPKDRLASVAIIDRAVNDFDKPVILAGNINARPSSSVLDAFRENWTILSDTAKLTFPSDAPNRTVDYIMGYKPKGQAYSVWQTNVVKTLASDHLPLFADVRLKTPKENIFRSPVYLQNPATDGMTIMWLTNVPCHSWVEYGTDSKNMHIEQTLEEGIAMANNTLNRIQLTGLKPGTRYYYCVHSREIMLYQSYKKEFGETASTQIRSFKTFDDKDSDFIALIFNDLHDIYPLFDKLVKHVKNIPYDVVFFNGDCICDVQTEESALKTISHYSRGIGGDCIPSVFIRGNHEARGAYSPFLWNLLGKTGGEHSYGAFNIGATRFVILDCGEDKPDCNWAYFGLNDFTQYRKNQTAFLKKEVASKDFISAQRRVLIHHIPIYGMRKNSFNPGRDEWSDIIANAPFDICINAHTHSFNHLATRTFENNFPVVIGGGNCEESATVMILRKKGKQMNLLALNAKGKIILLLKI